MKADQYFCHCRFFYPCLARPLRFWSPSELSFRRPTRVCQVAYHPNSNGQEP